MQISTTKEQLAVPLALVSGAADTRGTVPMLATVLLKATDAGKLSMLCSDSGMLARALTPCDVGKGGEIAVDCRRLSDIVRAVPDKQAIELKLEEKNEKVDLLIKAGRSRFRLPTLPAADYPRMTSAKEDRISVTMAAKRLADMIGEITPSMADADLRPFLNGSLFCLDGKGLWMVSTDGHRMTVSHEPIAGADTLTPRNIIVPRKTVLLAKKLLSQGGQVTLTLGARDVQFTFEDGAVLLGKAIDGNFPNWQAVIPATSHKSVMSCERLSSSLTMIAASIDKGDKDILKHCIEVAFGPTMTALNRGEDGHSEIDAVADGTGTASLSFNLHYLTDAVGIVSASSEGVSVGYNDTMTAITIRPQNAEYPLAVVMPMRG